MHSFRHAQDCVNELSSEDLTRNTSTNSDHRTYRHLRSCSSIQVYSHVHWVNPDFVTSSHELSELLLVYTLFNDRVMVGYPSVDLAFESFLLEHLTDT
jgi:hypothetical protein